MAAERVVFTVTLGELAEVPGSPFAYWAPKSLRELFRKYPPLDRDVAGMPDKEKIADVKQGLATADDLRFTLYWWEVPVEQIATSRAETRQGKKWVPFAKGGRPFYHDITVVVNWGNDGEEIRNFRAAVIRNEAFYFRPGLAWTKSAWIRNDPRLDVGLLPRGAIFTAKRMGIFLCVQDLYGKSIWSLGGFLRSLFVAAFLGLINPSGRNREVGHVALIPTEIKVFPNGSLARHFHEAYDLLKEWATGDETATVFVVPWVVQTLWRRQGRPDTDLQPVTGHPLAWDFSWSDWPSARAIREGLAQCSSGLVSLKELAAACVRWQEAVQARLAEIQRQIDDEVYRIYGISDEDRSLIEAELGRIEEANAEEEEEGIEAVEVEEEAGPQAGVLPPEEHIRRLVHYLAHQVIREDPDGIVPLHDCYPIGASEVERGLPYRVREKLKELFGPDALPQVEREIQEVLGRPLDEWLATDFFGYHVGLYRLRPVIWQIVPPVEQVRRRRSSAAGEGLPFSVFVYWHRLDADTLRKVRAVYLQSYLEAAYREAQATEGEVSELRASGAPRRRLAEAERRLQAARGRYETLRSLADRLDDLHRPHTVEVQSRSGWVKEKVQEIVAQGYRPVRDYGVRVNIEPLKQAGILPRDAQRVKG